jgi:Right handed beta helix region
VAGRRDRRGLGEVISRKGAVAALAMLAAFLIAATGCTPGAGTGTSGTANLMASGAAPASFPRVCGRPILDSPYRYDGRPGRYASGTPGLPTYGRPGSDFPEVVSGVVLAPGKQGYLSYQLAADTVYYLLPGVHVGFFQANAHDAFVGGFVNGTRSVLSGDYEQYKWAIDSNFSSGDQPGVTIEYLTIEEYQPNSNAAAINQSSNTGWTIRYDTVTLNVPGAGAIVGADGVLEYNCMTLNGQYGFQSSDDASWGQDSLTGGPYNLNIADNEISYNDTCDFEGLLNNQAIGWKNYDPVPAKYRNPHCGSVVSDGDQGGFKLWETNGVTIKANYIHNNWGPGIWADTNNANTTYVGNAITGNDGEAIIEEISYNFAILNNYIADNAWADGLSNPGFPNAAIYVSESGSSGVPPCGETSCTDQASYQERSVISGNQLTDNGGGIFLWQNSDRHCSSGFDRVCILNSSGQFTLESCRENLPSASIDLETYTGNRGGSPTEDWWDGCLWKTANVSVTRNVIVFHPGDIAYCNRSSWPDCGANGIFSEYSIAPPYNSPGGWVIATQVTFFSSDTWSDNTYDGPSTFYAWNQGNGDNPVSWQNWTGAVTKGDMCGSAAEHASGYCSGPFGQDAGSVYHP